MLPLLPTTTNQCWRETEAQRGGSSALVPVLILSDVWCPESCSSFCLGCYGFCTCPADHLLTSIELWKAKW